MAIQQPSKGKDGAPPKGGGGATALLTARPKAKTYDLSQITVLLVEDSPSMQGILTSMLRAFGVHDVLAANSALDAQGLVTFTQSRKKGSDVRAIDIVLTDYMMPDGTGLDLVDWIRSHKDEEIHFLPIIIISAHTTGQIVRQARDHGANEALVKPIAGGNLAARILNLIDNPRPFVRAPGFFGPAVSYTHL